MNRDHLDLFSLMLNLNIQAVVWQLCIWLAIDRLTSKKKKRKKETERGKNVYFSGEDCFNFDLFKFTACGRHSAGSRTRNR